MYRDVLIGNTMCYSLGVQEANGVRIPLLKLSLEEVTAARTLNPVAGFCLPHKERLAPMQRKENPETVAVKMPSTLVAAIDTLAKRQYRSRSDILRQGVIRELELNGLCPVVTPPAA